LNVAALEFIVVDPADSNVVALKLDEVVQGSFGPGFAFVYQNAKSAVGPVPASVSFVIRFAHTRVVLVQGLVHVSPAVPGSGLPTRQPPTM
jgi:hypothetical protein